MVTGTVNEHWEPVVELGCVLRDTTSSYPAVIDTGCNGYLSLPAGVVAQADWIVLGRKRYELANGRFIVESVYLARVVFDKMSFHVPAVATMADELLIGTRFLAQKCLFIDFTAKAVTVTDARTDV